MDRFAEKAFKEAEIKDLLVESEAYASVEPSNWRAVDLAALLSAGIKESAELISLAKKNGLEKALHDYAKGCMMGGFQFGYKAGRESMLEEAK